MTLEVRPLTFKPRYLNGLTEKPVVSHYENNYGGALRRLNAIEARIGTLDLGNGPGVRNQRAQTRQADRRLLHLWFPDQRWHRAGVAPPWLRRARPEGRDRCLARDRRAYGSGGSIDL